MLLAALACGMGWSCGPERPRRVVVAQALVPTSLDPNARLEEYSISVLSNVFESLVGVKRDLGTSAGLAEAWSTPDPRTWTFRLRPGVTLHDGRSLDSRLVARAVERAAASGGPGFTVDLESLDRVEAPDPRTVVIRTRRPIGFASAFAGLGLAFEPLDPGAPPVGTGPYRVASSEPGRRVSLVAFERYWNGPPPIARLDFEAEPDAARRVRLLEDGKAQLVVDVPEGQLDRLKREPRVKVIERPGLRVVFLELRCLSRKGERNVFSDVRVRQAVAAAIDRRALIAEALGGLGVPTDQIVPAGIYGHASEGEPQAPDRERARRLLREAGVAGAERVRLDFPEGRYRGIEKVAAVVATQLAAIGFDVAVRPRPSNEFIEAPDPSTQLWLMGWMSTRDAGISYDNIVHTREQDLGAFNWMGYSNRDVDRELDAFRANGTEERHGRLLQSVSRRLASDVPVLGLYQSVDVYAAVRELAFDPRPDRLLLGRDLAWASR